ncbi:MAG: L,D-transpeptidase family protein [Pirellulales bacterium]
MSSFKTVFLSVLLSAAAYGVYVAVTGKPPSDPPKEAGEWEHEPQVEMPAMPAPVAGNVPSQPTGTPPPAARGAGESSTAPPYTPAESAAGAPPYSPATAPENKSPVPTYPTTTTPASAYEPAATDVHGRSRGPDDPQSGQRYPSTDRYPADPVGAAVPAGYNGEQPATAAGSEFRSASAEAQALLDQGRLADALSELSQWFDDPRLTTTEQADLIDLLDGLAGTVIYSREHLVEPAYQVQPGDSLERIAEAYQVPWQLLAKINGISDPQRLRPGELLKVVRGPFDAVIDLDQFRLTLFLDGRYAGRFNVGVGQDMSTPEGEFVVLNKVANPTYYGPDRVIDADDPANPLGEFALDLGNQIWVHGTHDPASINQTESRGCIRLSPADIQDVFDILSHRTGRCEGSRVLIRR